MVSSDKWVVQLVIDQCVAHGVKHIVFSPGSRNAPFAIAASKHDSIETYVIHDERSAGFFGIGLSEKTEAPVALCCTSGSAPANYVPAITEAYYRNIPLIVISADRPNAWINQGDGQTIQQLGLFKEFVRYSCHLEDGNLTPTTQWQYQRETALLFSKATGMNRGPVHLNVGLSEPLYREAEKTSNLSRTIHFPINRSVDEASLQPVQQAIEGKKTMVICGQMPPNPKLQSVLATFSERNDVVILVENTSNLQSERFNACIDRSLASLPASTLEAFQPEILISIGGAVVSKKIKDFLRTTPLEMHIKVGFDFPEMDTYQQLSHSFLCDPIDFFSQLNESAPLKSQSNFFGKWKQLDYKGKDLLAEFTQETEHFTDFEVYQILMRTLEEGTTLHMGNSSVVRYCQLFDPIHQCNYFANRGTSGIDGSLSTALGYASKDEGLNVIIVGDISFLYDSAALQIQTTQSNVKILLINNHGGGIFRIIPGPRESDQLERYFEAQHGHTGAFAAQLGWEYSAVSTAKAFADALPSFLASDLRSILEIQTEREVNPKILNDFFTFIK